MELTQTITPSLTLFSGTYHFSSVYTAHFLAEGHDTHPLLTQSIKLSPPISRNNSSQIQLTAAGRTLERACRWYISLQRSPQMVGLCYDLLLDGESCYYMLFYFPTGATSKQRRVDRTFSFTLLILEVTADLPKPKELWPQLVQHIRNLSNRGSTELI